MEGRQPSNRSLLAIVWTAFVLVWAMAALIAVSLTQVIPCGGGGGSPYAAPASPAGRYCNAVQGYFSSGEPGELMTAVVYVWPLLVLAAVGAYGVWKHWKRLLVAVAVASSVLLALHVTLAFSLPDRCAPDDPTRDGCRHY
jgi:nitrate reductase NapE component